MMRRTSNATPPRKRCRGNLKPAPFFLTPGTVGKIVDLSYGKRIAQVPVETVQLVTLPRPAMLRQAQHEREERGEPDQLDWPDAPLPEEFSPETHEIASNEAQERPVVVHLHRGERPRIELIRAAAQRLRREKGIGMPDAKPLPGARQAKPSMALQQQPFAEKRAELDRAIRFLKTHCILVSVCDRDAQIRRYRVSGKRDPMLQEDVIAHAIVHGMTSRPVAVDG